MKVLIANPPNRKPIAGGMERYFTGAGCRFPFSMAKDGRTPPRYAPFPFFLAYASAVLERGGFSVKAIDAVPLNLTREEFLERAVEAGPDVVFMEPASVSIDATMSLCAELKRRMVVTVVLGGPHVTALPAETLRERPEADYVIVGEYELTLLSLLRTLRDGGDPSSLPGVAFRRADGSVQSGGRSARIDPIDHLPFPARHLFPAFFNDDIGLYHDGFCQGRPAVQMHASRGCPFRCNFCNWVQVLYDGGRRRGFSPERVVDEMAMVKERYAAREIYFDDDDFTADKEHVARVCEEIRRRRLKINWSVMGDIMVTDEPLLEKMAAAGCVGMKFGLESANKDVLKRMGKPVKPERIAALARKASSLGIKTHMTVTFGLLGETRETLAETFDFALRTDVDSVQFSVATPYPGTPFHRRLVEEGRLEAATWDGYDGHNSCVIRYDGFTSGYLHEFARKSNLKWLGRKAMHPAWMLRQFRYMGRLFRHQGLDGVRKRLARLLGILAEGLPPLNPFRRGAVLFRR